MNYNHKDWMEQALYISSFSEDPSVQNGAILVRDNSIISTGTNGLTRGVGNTNVRWERPAKYMWVEHAERNAIFHAATMGNSTLHAIMYCPWASCADCARAIVESGVDTLVSFHMPEADGWVESIAIGEQILALGGVKVIELNIEEFAIPDGLRLGQFRDR